MSSFSFRTMAALSLAALVGLPAGAQTVTPDLKAVAAAKGSSGNAVLEWVESAKGKPALKIQSKTDNAVVILQTPELADGVIEFDILGQSAPPQSCFIGMAFRVVDETTYDAVYFRPFNFRADDPVRKIHAVQYVSHPKYPWPVLREQKPGQYEKPIVPPPDGDAWFHARIVIRKPRVSVYVNGATEPSLVVDELSDRTGGRVALWVGPGQGGYLANVKVTPGK